MRAVLVLHKGSFLTFVSDCTTLNANESVSDCLEIRKRYIMLSKHVFEEKRFLKTCQIKNSKLNFTFKYLKKIFYLSFEIDLTNLLV